MPYHVLMKLLFGVSVLGHGQSAFRCKSIRYLGASWQGLWHIMAIRRVSSERPKRLSQFWQAFGRNLAGHAVQSNQLQCKYTTKWCMRQINQYKKYFHMSAHVSKTSETICETYWFYLFWVCWKLCHHHPTLQHVSQYRPPALSAHEQLHSEVYPLVRHRSRACLKSSEKIPLEWSKEKIQTELLPLMDPQFVNFRIHLYHLWSKSMSLCPYLRIRLLKLNGRRNSNSTIFKLWFLRSRTHGFNTGENEFHHQPFTICAVGSNVTANSCKITHCFCGWFPFHPKVLVHCAKVWFPFTFNCHPFRLPLPRPLHVSTADPSRLRLTLPVLHWEFHVCIKHQLCSQGWFYAQNIKNTMLRATNSSGLLLTFLMSCIHG